MRRSNQGRLHYEAKRSKREGDYHRPDRSDYILTLAQVLEEESAWMEPGLGGSVYEWDAVVCMREAAGRVFSSAVWWDEARARARTGKGGKDMVNR